jgi:hypothetical protein
LKTRRVEDPQDREICQLPNPPTRSDYVMIRFL